MQFQPPPPPGQPQAAPPITKPPAHIPKRFRLFGGALAHQMGMLDQNGSIRPHPIVEVAVSQAKHDLQMYFVAWAEKIDELNQVIAKQNLIIEELASRIEKLEGERK